MKKPIRFRCAGCLIRRQFPAHPEEIQRAFRDTLITRGRRIDLF